MPSRPPVHRAPFWRPPDVVKREHDKQRGTSTARGYDGQWRKLRDTFMAQHPNCQQIGCRSPAAEVHHRLSVRVRPDLRLSWGNLQSVCRSCHRKLTLGVA